MFLLPDACVYVALSIQPLRIFLICKLFSSTFLTMSVTYMFLFTLNLHRYILPLNRLVLLHWIELQNNLLGDASFPLLMLI